MQFGLIENTPRVSLSPGEGTESAEEDPKVEGGRGGPELARSVACGPPPPDDDGGPRGPSDGDSSRGLRGEQWPCPRCVRLKLIPLTIYALTRIVDNLDYRTPL